MLWRFARSPPETFLAKQLVTNAIHLRHRAFESFPCNLDPVIRETRCNPSFQEEHRSTALDDRTPPRSRIERSSRQFPRSLYSNELSLLRYVIGHILQVYRSSFDLSSVLLVAVDDGGTERRIHWAIVSRIFETRAILIHRRKCITLLVHFSCKFL